MSRQELEKTIKKCKSCGRETIHIRTNKTPTIGGFFIGWLLVFITCGLYLIPLIFTKRKGEWKCRECMENACAPYPQQVGRGQRGSCDIADLIWVLLAGAICAFVFWFFLEPLPIVYTSYSTGKCVSVQIEGREYDCDCLKDVKRYERVWVK